MEACLHRCATMQDAQQPPVHCVGVVLAGGRSQRMGRDKALLEYRGVSLLAHQVGMLSAVCEQVVVSGDYPGFDCVPDADSGTGPLAGQLAAAYRFQNSPLLFLAIDMPAMTPGALQLLRAQGAPCHYAGQPLPCYLPDAARLRTAIEAIRADAGKPSVQALHAALGSRELAVTDAALFENLNTPLQWQCFLAAQDRL